MQVHQPEGHHHGEARAGQQQGPGAAAPLGRAEPSRRDDAKVVAVFFRGLRDDGGRSSSGAGARPGR